MWLFHLLSLQSPAASAKKLCSVCLCYWSSELLHIPCVCQKMQQCESWIIFWLMELNIKRAQKYFPTSVLLFCNHGSVSTLFNHLWYLDFSAMLLWHPFLWSRTDNCIWCPLKCGYAAVSLHVCIVTVVIISLSVIFAINLSWRDNFRLFCTRCFCEPLLSRAARRCASVEETRGTCIQCASLSTPHSGDQNRTDLPGFVHCHQITLDKWRENCLIDEQSTSTHVINTLLMASHLSSILRSKTQRKVERKSAMPAPNWPPCNVKYNVSFARFCYLMACQEAVGTM